MLNMKWHQFRVKTNLIHGLGCKLVLMISKHKWIMRVEFYSSITTAQAHALDYKFFKGGNFLLRQSHSLNFSHVCDLEDAAFLLLNKVVLRLALDKRWITYTEFGGDLTQVYRAVLSGLTLRKSKRKVFPISVCSSALWGSVDKLPFVVVKTLKKYRGYVLGNLKLKQKNLILEPLPFFSPYEVTLLSTSYVRDILYPPLSIGASR